MNIQQVTHSRLASWTAAFLVCGAWSAATGATLDPTFGSAGILRLPPPFGPAFTSGARLGILGNGGLLYQSSASSWQSPVHLQRLDVNGVPVGSPLSWPDVVNAVGFPMLRTPDGRTLVGAMKNNVARGGAVLSDAAVVRLDANGDPDPTFGSAGVATIPLYSFQPRGGGNMVAALAVDSQGRILAAVAQYTYVNDFPVAVDIVRLDARGNLDTSYQGGRVASFYSDGDSTRLTSLYGDELRLDADYGTSYASTRYFGADGREQSVPTRLGAIFSYAACLCGGMTGWSFVGTVPNGDRMYAGIPTVPAVSLDSVTPGGRPGSVNAGIEYDPGAANETGQPLLARITRDGSRIDVVGVTPFGPAIIPFQTGLSTPAGTGWYGRAPVFTILNLPGIASRLQILDIGEQPDGSLIVTTQPSTSALTNTGYAAFRIRATGLPASGFVAVETPGLLLTPATAGTSSSSSSSVAGGTTSSSTSAATSASPTATTAAAGGGGALELQTLLLLATLLIVASLHRIATARCGAAPPVIQEHERQEYQR